MDPRRLYRGGPPGVASRDTNVAIVVREPIALLSEGKKLA